MSGITMRISECAALAHPWAPRHLDVLSGRKFLRRLKTTESAGPYSVGMKWSAILAATREFPLDFDLPARSSTQSSDCRDQ